LHNKNKIGVADFLEENVRDVLHLTGLVQLGLMWRHSDPDFSFGFDRHINPQPLDGKIQGNAFRVPKK
jgi:hypothetical protein